VPRYFPSIQKAPPESRRMNSLPPRPLSRGFALVGLTACQGFLFSGLSERTHMDLAAGIFLALIIVGIGAVSMVMWNGMQEPEE